MGHTFRSVFFESDPEPPELGKLGLVVCQETDEVLLVKVDQRDIDGQSEGEQVGKGDEESLEVVVVEIAP